MLGSSLRSRFPSWSADLTVILVAVYFLTVAHSDRVRSTPWMVVFAGVVLSSICSRVPPGVIARRTLFATLGIATVQVFKLTGRDPLMLRGAVYLLYALAGTLVLDGVAALVRVPLRRLDLLLTNRPGGRCAWGVAILAVMLPGTLFFLSSTTRNWYGDTLPTMANAIRTLDGENRDLSGFLGTHATGRWQYVGEEPHFVRRIPGHEGLYSSYPMGMDLFAWPGALIARFAGCDLHEDSIREKVEYRSAAVLAGVCLGLFFLVGLRIGRPSGAFALTLLLGVGSVIPSTLSQWLWQQSGVLFWMLVILLMEFGRDDRPGWKGFLLQGIACGCMLACRPSAVLFVIPFGAWVLLRDRERGLLLPIVATIAYAPFAWAYFSIYGNIVGPSGEMTNRANWAFGEYLSGVLLSPGRGLFVYQPWLFLLPLLFVKGFREDGAELPGRHRPKHWLMFFTVVVVLNIAMVSSWAMWWGGHSYGSRLLADLVPLTGLALVPVVGRLTRYPLGWAVVGLLAILGFAIHGPAMYLGAWEWSFYPNNIDDHVERLWDWTHPPFIHVRSW